MRSLRPFPHHLSNMLAVELIDFVDRSGVRRMRQLKRANYSKGSLSFRLRRMAVICPSFQRPSQSQRKLSGRSERQKSPPGRPQLTPLEPAIGTCRSKTNAHLPGLLTIEKLYSSPTNAPCSRKSLFGIRFSNITQGIDDGHSLSLHIWAELPLNRATRRTP